MARPTCPARVHRHTGFASPYPHLIPPYPALNSLVHSPANINNERMNTPRRHLLAAAATAVASTVLAAAPAQAQDYPQRPVKIIVPFSAGAAADSVARPLAARLARVWGQQVLVENRPGLTPGPQAAAAAAPDGYTLLMGATSTMVTTPLTASRLPYDVKRDFVPITRLVTLSPVLTVNTALKVKTLPELLALAKAQPGKLNYASSAVGAPNHLAMESLLDLTGTDMVHVPYKGAAPALVDLVGNQVQVAFVTIPSAMPHLRGGRLIALAVGSPRRSPFLPNVPAVSETVPGFDYGAWYGLFAPAKTPQAVIDKIRNDVAAALAAPEVKKVLLADGSEPAPSSAQELSELIDHESGLWAKVIKDRKIQVD